MNWQTLERHEFSSMFPDADRADYAALVESLRSRGWDSNNPIVLFEGKVLDGRHRQLACAETGIEPTFVEFNGTRDEARSFVISANLARRHLSGRAKVVAYHVENQFLPPDRQRSDAEIAVLAGMPGSIRFVGQARHLTEVDPDLAQKAAAGEIPVGRALRRHRIVPEGEEEHVTGGVFIVRRKKLLKEIEDAMAATAMTATKATNKAFELFVEWARARTA